MIFARDGRVVWMSLDGGEASASSFIIAVVFMLEIRFKIYFAYFLGDYPANKLLLIS